MSPFIPPGLGWIPDLPDPRDYTPRHEAIAPLLKQLKPSRRKRLPDEVDLRRDDEGEYFTAVEDQGPLNSSTAFAVLSLVEYFERRVMGRTFEGSRLFLYKVTRNLRQRRPLYAQGTHSVGDTGADLRTTFKALAKFGVPPEEVWPYDVSKFDEEPSPFAYRLARPIPGMRYFRLDEPCADGAPLWQTITSFLASGFPIAFGFSVPKSLTADANIPYRPDLDQYRGGQAALAVGYRNHHFGRGQHALLIRNSWGSQWGDNGHGWLPAGFLFARLSKRFWAIVTHSRFHTQELTRPAVSR